VTADTAQALSGFASARSSRPRERVLDPIARTSEILFGLIMVLTFTGTLSAATAGQEEVRTLLIAAIACNVAWGLVDAVMYVMSSLAERGRDVLTVRAIRNASTTQGAHRVIADALPPLVASILSSEDFEKIRRGLTSQQPSPERATLTRQDWIGALAVFLLVFLSTFPVVLPFLFFDRVHVALRASNLVAIVMLFALGYKLGRYGGHHALRSGFSLVALGVVLVLITIALGG
jgi:hypothetical protein